MKRCFFQILGMLLILTVIMLLAVLPAGAEVVDRIVAEVNDEIITLSELEQMVRMFLSDPSLKGAAKDRKGMQREVLEGLIDRRLARSEAKRRGITVADKELDEAIKEFRERNQIRDDVALAELLARDGMTIKDLRQQITDQIVQERMAMVVLGGKFTVKEEDVRRAYEQIPKEGGGNRLHLRVVSIPLGPDASATEKAEARKKAEVVLEELRKKVPFDEVVRKHGVRGEDVGFISPADLDPKLSEVLGRLKEGEVAPLETPSGFQLLQIAGKKAGQPGQVRSFEEMAPEIRRILQRQELEKKFSEWVKTLRAKSHVKIML